MIAKFIDTFSSYRWWCLIKWWFLFLCRRICISVLIMLIFFNHLLWIKWIILVWIFNSYYILLTQIAFIAFIIQWTIFYFHKLAFFDKTFFCLIFKLIVLYFLPLIEIGILIRYIFVNIRYIIMLNNFLQMNTPMIISI